MCTYLKRMEKTELTVIAFIFSMNSSKTKFRREAIARNSTRDKEILP